MKRLHETACCLEIWNPTNHMIFENKINFYSVKLQLENDQLVTQLVFGTEIAQTPSIKKNKTEETFIFKKAVQKIDLIALLKVISLYSINILDIKLLTKKEYCMKKTNFCSFHDVRITFKV